MTDIITNITLLNLEVNYWYRDSKLPKFIKKMVIKNNRKRLRSKVNELLDKPELHTGLLYEYFITLKDHYPPNGKFGHCLKINGNPPVMVFNIPIYIDKETGTIKEKVLVTIQFKEPFHKDAVRVIVTYTYYIKGNVTMKFSDCPLDSHPYIIVDLDANMTATTVRRLFVKVIKEDIKQHLYDTIEKSIERVE